MRHVSRTHRVALDWWFFYWINLDPKIHIKSSTNLQTCWQEGISNEMSGTIFFICLTSGISALSVALRISAWPAAPKRRRKGCKNRKERTGSWQSQSQRRRIWPSRQVLQLWRVRLCRRARGYSQSILSNRLVKFKELWREKCQSRRSVEFSRMAKRCSTGTVYSETCRDRRRPGTPELSWSFCT